MPSNEVKLIISAEDRASRTLAQIKDKLSGVENQASALTKAFSNTGTSIASLKSADSVLSSLRTNLVSITAAATAAFSGRELLRAAETYQTVAARVRLAAKSQAEFERAQAAVFDISQRTRAQLEATRTVYARIADATRRLGASQQEQFKFIEALNQALAINGSVGSEAASVILQLSQALGSGALRGDEFNSVNENGQRIMRALGDALGKTTGELRAMAEAGQLTSDLVFRGLLSQSGKLAQEFSQLPETVSGASTRLSNAFQKFVGEAKYSVGITGALAGVITGVATNFDTLGTVVLSVGSIMASVFSGRIVGAIAAQAAQIAKTASAQVSVVTAAGQARTQAIASAEAALAEARAHAGVTASLLAEARAYQANVEQLVIYGSVRAAANRQVAAAAAAHTAAAARIVSSEATLATATAASGAAAAAGAAGIGVLRVAVAALGGPIGAVITALSLGSIAWAAWGSNAVSASEKARRKLDETAEAARRVMDRLKGDESFGSGDLGTLRERAAQIEARIAVLAQSSGKSAGAAEELARTRKELDDVTASISKLEGSESKSAEAADALRRSLAQVGADGKKGAEDTIKAYENLRQALSGSFQEAIDKARSLREESRKATAELLQAVSQADEKAKKARQQGGGSITGDNAEQPLQSLQASVGAVRDSDGAVSALDVAIEKSQAVTAAAAGNMALFAQKIESAKEKLQALAESGTEDTAVLSGLANELSAVQAQLKLADAVALEEQAAGQAKLLTNLESKLDVIRKKAGNISVNLDISAAEKALDNLATKIQGAVKGGTTPGTYGYDDQGTYFNLVNIPQRAIGGPISGPGGPRDDKVLMWGSNGEFVQPAAAVRYYGHDFMEALRTLKIPRFASGGPVLPVTPQINNASASRSQAINLHWPGGGPFEVSTTPAIAAEMMALFRREALQRGARR